LDTATIVKQVVEIISDVLHRYKTAILLLRRYNRCLYIVLLPSV